MHAQDIATMFTISIHPHRIVRLLQLDFVEMLTRLKLSVEYLRQHFRYFLWTKYDTHMIMILIYAYLLRLYINAINRIRNEETVITRIQVVNGCVLFVLRKWSQSNLYESRWIAYKSRILNSIISLDLTIFPAYQTGDTPNMIHSN